MKSHRGLSAVIGTVFLIAIVIGALSYVSYSLDILGNFSEQLVAEESRQRNIQNEEFDITSIDVTSLNKLNATIKNTGEIPLKITTLWVDELGVDDVVQKITIDKTIAPGRTFDFTHENIDIDIDPTKGYNLKMISSRGQTQSLYINSGSVEPLSMVVHVLPKKVSTGFPASLLFVVANNMSNNNNLYNLTPNIEVSSANGLASFASLSSVIPSSYPVLKPGDVATFEYVYTVSGVEGQFIDFGISLQNGYSLPSDPSHIQSVNATVEVKDVELAIQSGSSLTSLGLETTSSNDADILLLHEETWGTPIGMGARQMENTNPDVGGNTYNTVDDIPMIFISSNMTQEVIVQQGKWNATLQYYSDITSPDVPTPSFAFFFECDDCSDDDLTAESVGNISSDKADAGNLKKDGKSGGGDNFPVWRDPTNQLYGDGPDGDGYYHFDGDDPFFKTDWDITKEGTGFSDVDTPPDSDAVWVRLPSATIDSYMPLIRFGSTDEKKDDENDRYEISIGTPDGNNIGKVAYEYETGQDEPVDDGVTKCLSTIALHQSPYLGKWQHIVGVRESTGACTLYINGSNVDTNVGTTGLGQVDVYDTKKKEHDPIKTAGIGSIKFKDEDADNTLYADVSSWMHWNDHALTSDEVEELYYTNYGDNGSRVQVIVNRTDSSGAFPPLETIFNFVDTMPFHDPAVNSIGGINYDFLSDDDDLEKYSQNNFTAISSGNNTISIDERVAAAINVTDTNQNLPIFYRIDDIAYSGDSLVETGSFLQSPETSAPWPTFLSFCTTAEVSLIVFNEGPEGIWFTFPGTRLVLTTNDSLTSYGAMPLYLVYDGQPNFSIDHNTDGPYVPNQATIEVKFRALHNPPSIPVGGNDAVVAGDYNAAVFLSGFDEGGRAFLKTVDLGLVHIINC